MRRAERTTRVRPRQQEALAIATGRDARPPADNRLCDATTASTTERAIARHGAPDANSTLVTTATTSGVVRENGQNVRRRPSAAPASAARHGIAMCMEKVLFGHRRPRNSGGGARGRSRRLAGGLLGSVRADGELSIACGTRSAYHGFWTARSRILDAEQVTDFGRWCEIWWCC